MSSGFNDSSSCKGPALTSGDHDRLMSPHPDLNRQNKVIRHGFECYFLFNKMSNIYKETLGRVSNGARFSVNFEKRSLRVDGKYLIKNGQYEGNLGCPVVTDSITEIERLFNSYRHSVPSQRSDNKHCKYFRALPEKELSDEDMLYGTPRELAQVELELFVLCQILQNSLQWDDFAGEKQWFWQSPSLPSLIMLKKWFSNKTEISNN